MSEIGCPFCGHMVHVGADVCPECGQNLRPALLAVAAASGASHACGFCSAALPPEVTTCPTCGKPVGGTPGHLLPWQARRALDGPPVRLPPGQEPERLDGPLVAQESRLLELLTAEQIGLGAVQPICITCGGLDVISVFAEAGIFRCTAPECGTYMVTAPIPLDDRTCPHCGSVRIIPRAAGAGYDCPDCSTVTFYPDLDPFSDPATAPRPAFESSL